MSYSNKCSWREINASWFCSCVPISKTMFLSSRLGAVYWTMHVIAQNLISSRFTHLESVFYYVLELHRRTRRYYSSLKVRFSLLPSKPITPNRTKCKQLYGLTSVRVLHEINIAFLGKSLDIELNTWTQCAQLLLVLSS